MSTKQELDFIGSLVDPIAAILGTAEILSAKTPHTEEVGNISDAAKELCELLKIRTAELKRAR